MSEFTPVSTKADLDCLDSDEIVAGYRVGFDGVPEPGSDRSRSYWHGWRNGMVDGGHATIDVHQHLLAHEVYGPTRLAGMT